MNVGQLSPSGSKKIPDQSDSSAKKPDEPDDPKPRIVLTFRSEKTGAKSNNMKIVSSEEKHEKGEEVSLRRSSRARPTKYEFDDTEASVSPKKDKSHSETDETVTTPKRSSRGRSKEVDSTSPIKKDSTPSTRLSRRIKPTAKVLENEELLIGLESRNNARLGLQVDKSPEEGVCTRRSVRSKTSLYVDMPKEEKKGKSKGNMEKTEAESQNQVLKLKHLCELGLKARSPEDDDIDKDELEEKVDIIEVDVDQEVDVIELDDEEELDQDTDEDQEVDDDTEVITKLLEDDDDSDYSAPLRPSTARSNTGSEHSETDDTSEPRRRSTRKRKRWWDESDTAPIRTRDKKTREEVAIEPEDDSEAAPGSAGCEAERPTAEGAAAACCCEQPSNLYEAPSDLTESPSFCQALETVEGVRVGCCHTALRRGADTVLQRCGPRAPFVRLCALHQRQMRTHMCCTTCGMFCTQGIFYQCSLGHLFHLECGLPLNDTKRLPPGCPHCGLVPRGGDPVSRQCSKVRVQMQCSNKRVFLQEQREHCPTAYLGFVPSKTSTDDSPVIPEDLLPSPPIDLKSLCLKADKGDKRSKKEQLESLHEAILAGDTVEELIPKIMSGPSLNTRLSSGVTCLHSACCLGRLTAVYLLHYGGADLDAIDDKGRTPLITAVTALLEKPENSPKKAKKSTKKVDKDPEELNTDTDHKEDGAIEDTAGGKERASDVELMKVIRYLVAAGCDVNVAGPEGVTALHIAAQHGSSAACAALLTGRDVSVDARDHGGWTPLVWAAENGHHHTVSLLLSHGADALAVDVEGNAAVHWCALSGAARCLTALLDAQPAAPRAINRHADTPLHVAARQGHYSCVVILLARGAKTDVENSAGELPVEVCSGKCQSAISLNMQMTIALRNNPTRQRLLTGDISRGREPFPVPCVNEIDDTPLPEFTYVTANVMPTNIVIDNSIQTMQGCACTDGDCSSVECACVSLSVRRWARGARLLPAFPHHDPPMLFTCNHTCGCHQKKCTNNAIARLVSTGSVFVRTQVFRVGGGRGWGLRAAAKIPRGTLVATYCGELLPVTEADSRNNDQYMFALQLKPDLLEQCAEKTQLCIDAHTWGGAARFINHSCRPNVACVRVFTGTRDLRLPTVAMFATTNVQAGDELTFDYGDKFWGVKSKWMRCECGSADCRYPEVKGEDNAENGTAPD